MKKHLHIILLSIFSLSATGVGFAAGETLRLTGQEGGRQPAFKVDGPWLLDWSTNSDFPLHAHFVLQLYDGESGDFIGTVAELRGTGRGLKLFEDAGTYQLEIVAGNISWDIEITEVSQEQSGEMKRAAEGRPSLRDSSRQALRRIPESSFASWRAVDDGTLLLFNDIGAAWRVSFSPECPGLESATAISFVAPLVNEGNQYDSILLDDGTRCYFNRVNPTTGE